MTLLPLKHPHSGHTHSIGIFSDGSGFQIRNNLDAQENSITSCRIIDAKRRCRGLFYNFARRADEKWNWKRGGDVDFVASLCRRAGGWMNEIHGRKRGFAWRGTDDEAFEVILFCTKIDIFLYIKTRREKQKQTQENMQSKVLITSVRWSRQKEYSISSRQMYTL